ncbi:MAG: Trk system potassium transporter TrkA [Alphaproteobacteria bacterium]|nr:Trk system potassium transporter TrkA [Alphaproteobacteria bacterium]
MKVIICGAGQVGFNIARSLSAEGNDVTVLDINPDLVAKVTTALDVKGLVGFASYPSVLEQAGAADSDMIIAVTFADEVNMVACEVAHALFNVPTKIARVRSQNYLEPQWRDLFRRDSMAIDVIISPEIEVARAIMRRLDVPGALDVIEAAEGRVRVTAVRLEKDCPIADTPLERLAEMFPDLGVFVVGIIRGDRLVVPHGGDSLRVGDEVYFVAPTERVSQAMAAFGHREREARRILIVGGGNVGLFLARQFEEEHPNVNVKIIEINRDRAAQIADQLSRTVVLHGDALDRDILEEANVANTETVVAVSNDDEVNILASLLAKRFGAVRAVTLINSSTYGALIGSLGVDVTVNPRETTVSRILEHVRRGRISAVHSLREGIAEIIEAEALDTSPIVGRPMREAKLPQGVRIGAIVRDGKVVVPRGDTVIKAKDRVIIFAETEMVKKFEKLFSVRFEFF